LNKERTKVDMWRKYGMPAILYPLPKIVKNFNTIVFTGGTDELRDTHFAIDTN
jgi:hypothetical protein